MDTCDKDSDLIVGNYNVDSKDNVEFFNSYVIKTGDSRIESTREVFAIETIKNKGYEYTPEIYSLGGKIITMERIYGDTILEHFKKYPKTKGDITKQMKKLVSIMFIKCNIFYGDFHSGNFLIDSNHNLWIFDFNEFQFAHKIIKKEKISREELYKQEINDAMYLINESYKCRNKF